MTQQRTRQRGVGKILNYKGTTGPTSKTLRFTFTYTQNYTQSLDSKYNTSPKTVTVGGFSVTVPAPPRVKMTQYEYYSNVKDATWRANVVALLQACFSPSAIAAKASSGLPLVESVDSGLMVDTIGSRFREYRGKEAVVNECFSESIRSSFNTFPSAAASANIVQVGPGSISTTNCNIIFDVTYTLPFVAGVTDTVLTWLDSQLGSFIPLPSAASALHADSVYDLQQGEMDLLTSIAEMDKTIKYVLNRLTVIGMVIRCVRRKDLKGLKEIFKNPGPDPWLEARYAIRPLMIDTQNLLSALAASGSLSKLKRASRSEEINSIQSLSGSFSDSNYSYQFEGTVVVNGFLRGGAIGKLSANLPSLYTYGGFNVATTAIELIPWSFVVQWFVNISGLIASLNPNPVYELQNGFVSVKASASVVGELTVTNGSSTTKGPISYALERYNRWPKKQPQLFSLDINLDIPKVIDLLAFAFK